MDEWDGSEAGSNATKVIHGAAVAADGVDDLDPQRQRLASTMARPLAPAIRVKTPSRPVRRLPGRRRVRVVDARDTGMMHATSAVAGGAATTVSTPVVAAASIARASTPADDIIQGLMEDYPDDLRALLAGDTSVLASPPHSPDTQRGAHVGSNGLASSLARSPVASAPIATDHAPSAAAAYSAAALQMHERAAQRRAAPVAAAADRTSSTRAALAPAARNGGTSRGDVPWLLREGMGPEL